MENDWLKIVRTDRSELRQMSSSLGLRGKMDLEQVNRDTQGIIDQVRQNGDRALIELTQQFDQVSLTTEKLRVSEQEIGIALEQVDIRLLNIMRRAADNIGKFHEAQKSTDLIQETAGGGSVRLISRALDIVGIYVPGGTAALPSSVLMNCLPARAAGVRRVIMCTPPGADGMPDPLILAAASIAGVDEIYRVGGAQAVAALAYGTESIPRVDKITGPGNIYVNTAKRLVYGQVDIDMFAGPSEVLIIADDTAKAEFVAADLLAQAEHDILASALLVTDSLQLAQEVAAAVTDMAENLPRRDTIRRSLQEYGAILVVPDLKTAVEFANELAPEHLELIVSQPDKYLAAIRNAGAVFIGSYSPEALGDYLAGPNHVLPTSGTARFFSPLNTGDFIKKMNIIHYTRDDLAATWKDIAGFADAEKLAAHAESARIRFSIKR